MLYPHSALQYRYSEYHTFRIQLNGYAEYTIIPPEFMQHLHLFPSIHVAAYQSQINFKFPKIKSINSSTADDIRGQHVSLCPGEVLYIPPFHSVRVDTDDVLAVGIDVLSPSLEQLILLEGYSMPVPFKNVVESMEERVIAAQVLA